MSIFWQNRDTEVNVKLATKLLWNYRRPHEYMLLYNDVPMEIVSELLGHSSMKITQEYYGKVVQKRVSQEIFRLMGKK